VQESDTQDFERAFLRLCAGFDTPPTGARKDAYWRAFRKLSVLEFAGLIDASLVESTFASMPTVGALWDLHRKKSAPADQMPRSGHTLQEQLSTYVMRRYGGRLTQTEIQRPWTYLYREWHDGNKRCCECTGVLVERDNGSRMRIPVAEMHTSEFEHA
jgi:hypothetical protein